MENKRPKYDPAEDLMLFKRISASDHEAFRQLYARYAAVIYGFCLRYLRNEVDAEDALQHIFLKLWEKRRDLNITMSMRDYLYASAKHYILNQLRNRLTAQTKQHEMQWRNQRHQGSVEEDYLRHETGRNLEMAALMLSPVKQKIISLRREGFTNKEISQKLQMPENTVKTYYAQSLKFLRDYFRRFELAIIPLLGVWVSQLLSL